MSDRLAHLPSPARNLDALRTGIYFTPTQSVGAIAQLGERVVRNDEVGGSIPPGSTDSHKLPRCPVFLETPSETYSGKILHVITALGDDRRVGIIALQAVGAENAGD